MGNGWGEGGIKHYWFKTFWVSNSTFKGSCRHLFLFKPEPAHLLCPAVGTWNEMCKSFLNKKPKWTNKLWHALKYVDLCSLTEKSKAWVVGILHCTAVSSFPAKSCTMFNVMCALFNLCALCICNVFKQHLWSAMCKAHCALFNQCAILLFCIISGMGVMGVQMWKAPRSNQEWCLSLKLGDTDLRAAALQEMKHNNTMLQIRKKKKSLVEKG